MASIWIPIISTGRYRYLERTLDSLKTRIDFGNHNVHMFLHEDRTSLHNLSESQRIIDKFDIEKYILTDKNIGSTPAVKNAWSNIPECDYVWHQEDDFTFNIDINIDDFIEVLEREPASQLLLERDDWRGSLKNIFDFVDIDVHGIPVCAAGDKWTFFSTNPCLIKKTVIDDILKSGIPTSEQAMDIFLRSKGLKSYYYGHVGASNMITHIGYEKVGDYSQQGIL